ncbi:MAG: replication-associated recombination protein A [Patescibacteria group bacterium]
MDKEKAPLAERIRPKTLNEFVGQEHLVGKGGVIRKLIEKDKLASMIFWGPPGSGKTTLANIIAKQTKSDFVFLSATISKLDDVRKTIGFAKQNLQAFNKKTILFIDEIHRFNKAQQDAFLPHVEDGSIILIGATTENPSFEVIGPLLSRCKVFVLNQLEEKELAKIFKKGAKETNIKINPKALKLLLKFSNGDARIGLNAIEIAKTINKENIPVSETLIKQIFQKEYLRYDLGGEEHYNTISAFIKSMRASNPDAALYYLARMNSAGEDLKFIARRMVIFASEDIGMAQPTALVVANEVFEAVEKIGPPEAQINLAHGTVYLSLAKKDRSAYDAYFAALKDVKTHGNLPIPLSLRNAPTKLMETLNYGKGYEMYPEKDKSLLPEKLENKKYYKK